MLSRLSSLATSCFASALGASYLDAHPDAHPAEVDGIVREDACRLLCSTGVNALPTSIRDAALHALTSMPEWGGLTVRLVDGEGKCLPGGRFPGAHDAGGQDAVPRVDSLAMGGIEPAELEVRCESGAYACRDGQSNEWVDCGVGAAGLFRAILLSLRARSECAYLEMVGRLDAACADHDVPVEELRRRIADAFHRDYPAVLWALHSWQDSRKASLQAVQRACALVSRARRFGDRDQRNGLKLLQHCIASAEQLDEAMICLVLRSLRPLDGGALPDRDAVLCEMVRHLDGAPHLGEETIGLALKGENGDNDPGWAHVLRSIVVHIDRAPRLSDLTIRAAMVDQSGEPSPERAEVLSAMARYFTRARQLDASTLVKVLQWLPCAVASRPVDDCLQSIADRVATAPQLSDERIYDMLDALKRLPAARAKRPVLRAIAEHIRTSSKPSASTIIHILSAMQDMRDSPSMGVVLEATARFVNAASDLSAEMIGLVLYELPKQLSPARECVMRAMAGYFTRTRGVAPKSICFALQAIEQMPSGGDRDDFLQAVAAQVNYMAELSDQELVSIAHALRRISSGEAKDAVLIAVAQRIKRATWVNEVLTLAALRSLTYGGGSQASDALLQAIEARIAQLPFRDEVVRAALDGLMGIGPLDDSNGRSGLVRHGSIRLSDAAKRIMSKVVERIQAMGELKRATISAALTAVETLEPSDIRDALLLSVAEKLAKVQGVDPVDQERMASQLLDMYRESSTSQSLLRKVMAVRGAPAGAGRRASSAT